MNTLHILVAFALGAFGGGIAVAVWLKQTGQLVAKVKAKADEYKDEYLDR